MDGHSKRDNCRLCGSKNVELAVPMPASAIADAYVTKAELNKVQPVYPIDLYFCRDCAHVQLLDVVDPKLMFKPNYTYLSGSSAGIVKHFGEYAQSVLNKEKPAPNSLVIDIGSNDGTLLRFFKDAGMRVLGVDPALELAKKATAAGIPTIARFLDAECAAAIRKDRGAARIVTANNVFAHADDLGGMADHIRSLLAPDGLFVFEVSYLIDVVDHMLLGTIFHEHLCYHSVKPLNAFLSRHGLELIDIEHVTIQGGSIIGFAQLACGPRRASPKIAEMIREEERGGFDKPAVFAQFHERIEAMKRDTQRLIDEAGPNGAGYGAARGGTMLLYRLDLGRQLKFIVDDSPDKQNLYSPGHHIPILPPEALYERKPDWVFLLAWVHAKAITAKHQRFMDQGGRFIVAHPTVQFAGSGKRPVA